MRRHLQSVPLFLIATGVVGVVLLHGALLHAAKAAAGDTASAREIRVSGSAMVPSDLVATLALNVQSDAADGQAAESANQKAVERVVASLKGVGVASSDIVEGPFRLQPVKGTSPTRFQAEETLKVTLGTKAHLVDVIEAALRAGATSASGVTYVPQPPGEAATQKLVREAVTVARRKAGLVAQAFGVTLGPPLSLALTAEGPRTGPAGQSGWGVSVELTYRF